MLRAADKMGRVESTLAEAPKSLLIVDDEPLVLESIKRSLRKEDLVIHTALSGSQGLDIIDKNNVDVVLSDQMMPNMDGVTFLSKVKQQDPLIVRLLLTGYASIDSAIAAINRSQIFEYLTKPWDPDHLRSALHRAFDHRALTRENRRLQEITKQQNHELKVLNNTLERRVEKRTQQLARAVEEGILMLSLAAEAKDDTTGEHIRRIQTLTTETCLKLGMTEDRAKRIGFFSMMHDVGKIHIPDHILNKKGPLDADEWRIMMTHTTAGEKIMGKSPYYEIARQIARSHHERMDGKGYPDGLTGRMIPLPARIVAVADVYDALVNERPYKKAWPIERAIDELRRSSGSQFEADIVTAFIDVVEDVQRKKRSK